MRILKKLLLFLLAMTLLLTPFASAADEGVYVFLDGEEVVLPNINAYFDTDIGIIMAPITLFSNELDVDVDYDIEAGTVILSREDTTMLFTVEETAAKLNSRNVTLDTPPVLKDGEVYVPLRFAAENLGYELDWNSEGKRVEISTVYDYELGITREQMLQSYGTPSGTLTSEKGYVWQVYQGDDANYQLIGLDGDRVVAYYVNSETWKLPSGVQYGTKLATCQTIMNGLGYQSTAGSGYTTYTSDDASLTVYYQETGDFLIYAARLENAEYTFQYEITPAALSGMEQILADLTNVMRVRAGYEPLSVESGLCTVAKNHSNDMAEHNFFGHLGTDGSDKAGRLEAAGYSATYASEAISKAYPDSFSTFASFYSNSTYQEILNANYDATGIGYSYNPDSDGVLYCVQLFFADVD